MDRGADVTIRDTELQSVLHAAVGHPRAMEVLLQVRLPHRKTSSIPWGHPRVMEGSPNGRQGVAGVHDNQLTAFIFCQSSCLSTLLSFVKANYIVRHTPCLLFCTDEIV